MRIDDDLIEKALKEMARTEEEACEAGVPIIYLYADDPDSIGGKERAELELHLKSCKRCQGVFMEARQSLAEDASLSSQCHQIVREYQRSPAYQFMRLVQGGMTKIRALERVTMRLLTKLFKDAHAPSRDHTIIAFDLAARDLPDELNIRGRRGKLTEITEIRGKPPKVTDEGTLEFLSGCVWKVSYCLGDKYPRYVISTPPQAKYRTVVMVRRNRPDAVILTDNVRLEPADRDTVTEFVFVPEFKEKDKGSNILYVLMTTESLDIDIDEEDVSLERFTEILSQLDISRGDAVQLIEVEVFES